MGTCHGGSRKKLIVATAVAREPQNFPCHACDCDAEGRSSSGSRWIIGHKANPVLVSEVCPRRLITAQSQFFLDLYRHYKNGVLPFSGGLLEQPYTYFRAMTVIDEWFNR